MIVDIHSHMLPAIDDGAENFEITKEMIQMAYDEGCRYLFFTPHSDSLSVETSMVKEKFEMVKSWINENYSDLKAYLGCEIYADPDDFERIDTIIDKINRGIYLTLNDTKYVLIEFYLGGFEVKDVIPSIKALKMAGYIPVIAHVERYGIAVKDIKKLKELGCMIQINIGNVFNPKRMAAMSVADKLIQDKVVDFIGTDAHGMDWRPPEIKRNVEFMRNLELFDSDYVEDILYRNVQKYLIKGE